MHKETTLGFQHTKSTIPTIKIDTNTNIRSALKPIFKHRKYTLPQIPIKKIHFPNRIGKLIINITQI
ncbi:hypothetical protein PcP3B5_56350 [Pseudomonas citronellolis]|nr:hypothetical protein PcP3B5_56350 [Pseudomonas citronellolis]